MTVGATATKKESLPDFESPGALEKLLEDSVSDGPQRC